jgi:peptidoglycan/xylan/chitin deacetylase (PgdA/CDA1 family)
MTWSRNRQKEVIQVATPEPPMRAGILSLLLALPCAVGCGPVGGVETADPAGGSGNSAGAAGSSGNAGGGAGSAGAAGAAGTSGGSGGSGGSVVQGGDVGAITVEGVAPFRGAASGAYTIMHDDLCDYNIDSLFDVAAPELEERGLRAAFGVIVQRCVERAVWSKVNGLVDKGHEIMNHTWTHEDIGLGADIAVQIDQATTVLNANLTQGPAKFFIFPYDSFTDDAVAHLATLGYVGARAGSKGLNQADFDDGLRVMFDVYGGENSIYMEQGDILKYYVDLAIEEGGWAVREFHGIADQTFFPVPVADYEAHLDYVKSKVDTNELWVETPTRVIDYRFARMHCGSPVASGNGLSFPTTGSQCPSFPGTLSVILTTAVDVTTLYAVQQGLQRATKKLGPGRYTADIDPMAGMATITGD